MHSVTPYSFRIYNPHAPGSKREDKYVVLNKIGNNDLLEILAEFIDINSKKLVDISKSKHTFLFTDIDIDKKNRTICGNMRSGHYGIGTDIVDTTTGIQEFKKAVRHAELVPYYFQLSIPSDGNEGVALFHSYRGNGTKTLFFDSFSEYFQGKHQFSFQMNPLSYEKAFKEWLSANTKEIRLTRFDTGNDLADRVKGLGHVEAELKLKPKRRSTLGKLQDFFQPDTEQSKLIEVLTPTCKEIKTVVEMNGRKRTITVGSGANQSLCQIDVPDVVTLLDGLPTFPSMQKWCIELSKEFLASIYPDMKAAP